MLTPTISLPDDLMAPGTVFAIASTFWALTAVVAVVGPLCCGWLAPPDNTRAPVAANAAARRQIFFCPPCHPADTVASTFCFVDPARSTGKRNSRTARAPWQGNQSHGHSSASELEGCVTPWAPDIAATLELNGRRWHR